MADVEMARKKFLFLHRKAPHGTIYALEGLEAVLIFCSYEQEISLLFMDDGVFSLMKDQDTSELGTKGFSSAYRALDDYGVARVCVDKESLELRGLSKKDLIIDVKGMNPQEIAELMNKQDVILPF
jgi:tRNA 2-thiouridine synthesizing protein C